MNYTVEKPWHAWSLNNQVAGYAVGYANNFTFLTVKGAGTSTFAYASFTAVRWCAATARYRVTPRRRATVALVLTRALCRSSPLHDDDVLPRPAAPRRTCRPHGAGVPARVRV
jgi:hypothetical protein